MLDAMRRGAVNWLSKILLALLVVAFAVWGVADVFRGYGRGTLARIGNTEISERLPRGSTAQSCGSTT